VQRCASVVYKRRLKLLHNLRIVGHLVAHAIGIQKIEDAVFASAHDEAGVRNQQRSGRT